MAVAVAEKVVPIEGKRPRVDANELKLGEHCRRTWFIRAPEGATKEDPLYELFWEPVARRFTRHDIVALLANDESWEMELCVEAVKSNGAKMSVRKVYGRDPIAHNMTSLGDGEYHTEFRANERWCVIRRKDQFPVVKGHPIEELAIAEWRRTQPRPVV
jgi:hypothetical protein